jgi:hypothetical protein
VTPAVVCGDEHVQQPIAAPGRGAGELLELRGDVVHGYFAVPHPHLENLGLHAGRLPAGGYHHPTPLCRCRGTPAGGPVPGKPAGAG